MIRLDAVKKSFDGKVFAVRDVSLHIARGELVVLLGQSGCGKTTTLKMVNRVIEPTDGTIVVDGKDTRAMDPVALRRSIGYVLQRTGLFPHMTVAENIAIVPALLRWSRQKIDARVDELLELVRLPPARYRHRSPRELSGGQAQRVGVARALAARPQVMLMDEPFGALDPLTRDALQAEYRRIHLELGLTTLMVTHDMTEALLLADRIAVMDEGRIIQLAPPGELLSAPATEYVRALMQAPRRQIEQLQRLTRADAAGA
jgi:osmoprotectant transport system ATP-binding protein